MNVIRLGGWIGLVGGILGLVYAPFHAASYLATPSGSDDELPSAYQWSDRFRDALPWAFDFDTPDGVYEAYGLVSPWVMAALAFALVALHLRQREALRPWGTWTFRAFIVGHVLLALGAFAAFYVMLVDAAFFTLIVPGLLLTMLGYVVYGSATIRARVVPRAGAWLMTIGGAAVLPLAAILGHNPIGFSLVYVAWILVGPSLARSASSAPPAPAAAPPG